MVSLPMMFVMSRVAFVPIEASPGDFVDGYLREIELTGEAPDVFATVTGLAGSPESRERGATCPVSHVWERVGMHEQTPEAR